MRIKQKLILIPLIVLFSGCSSGIQQDLSSLKLELTPSEDNTVILEDSNPISYIAPKHYQSDNFHFITYDDFIETGHYERIKITRKGDIYKIEKRDDNGTAGSGNFYKVQLLKKDDQFKFVPLEQHTYQEGLILPFPVPDFDIYKYLTSTVHLKEVELNSEYGVDSIRANFTRMLESNRFNVEEADVEISVKVFPYKNGSKSIVKAKITTKDKNGDNTINLKNIFKQVEDKLKEVVNS